MDWQTTAAILAIIVAVITIIGFIIKGERTTNERHASTRRHSEGKIEDLRKEVRSEAKDVQRQLQELHKLLQEYQLHVATRYMDKAEIQENFAKLLDSVQNVERGVRNWLVGHANTDGE